MSEKSGKNKVETVEEWTAAMRACLEVMTRSKRKDELARAFRRAECLAKGPCVCDTCDKWDGDVHLVYELARCIFTTKAFQLIKEAHVRAPRWKSHVRGMYAGLFSVVYEDILPETGLVSNGGTEHQACPAKFTRADAEAELKLIRGRERPPAARAGRS